MPPLAFDERPRSGVLCLFSETVWSLADYLGSTHLFCHIQFKFCINAPMLDPIVNLCLVQVRTVIFFLTTYRSVFLLLLLPLAKAVCTTCWGAGIDCKVGSVSGAVCPWSSQMTDNAKSIAAAAGGALVVGSLLTNAAI